MTNKRNILDQILFLYEDKNIEEVFLLSECSQGEVEEKTILFTSLHSWNKYSDILDQHYAMEEIEGKHLKVKFKNGEEKIVHLHLLHQNLSPHLWNCPGEIKAHLEDFNDEWILRSLPRAFKFLNIHHPITSAQQAKEEDFFKKEKERLDRIDFYRRNKEEIIALLGANDHELAQALRALILKKNHQGRNLSAIDALLYTETVAQYLGFYHLKKKMDGTVYQK